MRRRLLSTFFLALVLSVPAMAQFSGNDSPEAGSSEYYTYFLDVYTTSPNFQVSGGSIVSEGHNGMNHDLTVQWDAPGSGSITFRDGGTPYDTYYVTISCPTVSNPSTTFSYTQNCGNTVITRNASPPSGVTWFWQTASSGTSTSSSGSTYQVSAGGTYYLRARSTGYSTCWSSGSTATSSVAVNVVPGAVTSPTGASRCGTGTVTLSATTGANGSGVKWYNAAGTHLYTGNSYVTPSISTTSTYYAGTYVSATGCESARTAITATINPLPGSATSPTSSPSAVYGTQSVNLTAGGDQSGETFAWYAASSGGTAISSTQSVDATKAFWVSRKVTATGCESASRVSVTVPAFAIATITPSATQYIAYGGSANLSANSGYFSYQWKLDGVDISGATSQTHTAKQPGVYTVTVKGSSTAPTHTSPTGVTVSGILTQTLNLVSETRLFKEGLSLTSVIDTLSREKLAQSITYMDGMGRPFQSVAVAASPDQYDLVSASGPEKQGLAITSHLPYVSSANDGRYRPYALRGSNGAYSTSEQYDFYQNASLVAHDTKPYSKVVYRQTPDARAIESGAPGIHWQPDSAHTVRSQITFNQDLDSVRKWNSVGASSGYYVANTVVVETTTDENGNQVKTFVNALGQTVLKKVQHDTNKWLKTYYVYDEYGRLRYQVPPRAVGLLDGTPDLVNDTNLAELIYRYDYDNRDRVSAKKIPGATDEEYLVYDKLDRVVLTQDGNLKDKGKWMFIKYDYYGRPAYSGLFASADSRATLQAALDAENYAQSGVKWYETEAAGPNDYSNQAYPRSNTTVLTVNYYDHYDFNRNGTADYSFDGSHLSGQETTALATARGSATGSRRRTINAAGDTTSVWLKSVIFYGAYDRVIQTLSNNHLYTTLADKTTVIYNFAGQVLKSKTTHSSSATESVSFVDRPVYDHAGRVVKQYRNINSSQTDQLVAEYVYNKLGQVVDKKLHDTGSGVFLQSVDYRYNIRGWLTSINNAQLTSDGTLNNDTGDYFGMELAYQQGIAGMGVSKQYNGNVSAVKWRSFGTTGAADQRSYKFSYDKSDRLTGSTFQASTYVSSTVYWDKEVNTLNETQTYDANGNVKTLVRKRNSRGLSGGEVTSTAQTIDDLSYIYQSINGGTQNTNRLARVNEAVSGTTGDAGFKNGASSDTEFAYSAWGSATKDENKGISAIDYNVLGKARRVTYTSGKVVEYTYDAAGTKLTMKVFQGATVESLTSYVGGFVYEGATPALSFFASPEGRVVKNGSSYEYQYSISDHQGNTRILFTSATPTTSTYTATFETSTQTAEQTNFNNYPSGGSRNSMDLYDHTDDGSTYTYSYLLTGGYDSQVGLARSFHAYPGDSVKIEAWAKYYGSEGGTSNVAGFATALLSAFSLSAPGGGETGTPSAALNTWGGLVAGGDGGDNESHPKAFVNIIVFDKNYNLLDIAYDGINGGHQVGASPDVAHDFMKAVYAAKEECFVYVYISNENANLIDVYFDDVVMTHKRSRLIQGNEYYPFGMQTANSWTREAVTGNNYLANGGTELNATTQLYDLEFRNYDPALGRMVQMDPVAAKYASLTPYNYSFNNPIAFADPSGADPDPDYQNPNHQYYFHNGAGAAGYPGLTYDDWIPQNTRGEYNNAFGWRTDFALGWFNGSGPSLNSSSFAYQSGRYQVGLVMRGIGEALVSSKYGGSVNIYSGHLTKFDLVESAVVGATYKYNHGTLTESEANALFSGVYQQLKKETDGVDGHPLGIGSPVIVNNGLNTPGGWWDGWGVGTVTYDGKRIGMTNFIGPGPSGPGANPYRLSDGKGNFLSPIDAIDEAAQRHDDAYWKAGVGGLWGAFFAADVLEADIRLFNDANSIRRSFMTNGCDNRTGFTISERTNNLATAVSRFFGLVILSTYVNRIRTGLGSF